MRERSAVRGKHFQHYLGHADVDPHPSLRYARLSRSPHLPTVRRVATLQQDEAAAQAVPAPRGRFATFRALRHRDYRLLWFGQLGHSASQWMEQVIRPVLVYELTESATAVAWVVFMRMLPVLLFGVLAGAAADRFDKKRILFITQNITASMHFLLAFLVLSGRVELWQIYATAMVAGAAFAFNQPARQTIVPRIVPPEDLLNAVALNTAAMNFMRIGGGAIAGLLLIALSIGGVYLLNGVIYIGVIVMTVVMHVPRDEPRARRSSLLADLGEGFAYVQKNRAVGGLVLLALILYVFGMPYQQVFVPLVAFRIFELDRSWVGWMLSFTGLGAIVGSLFVASRTEYRRPGLALGLNLVVFGSALLVVALSRWLPLTLLALAVAGSMTVSFMALTNTLLLSATPPELQGRVLSLMSLDRGIIPAGALLAGFLAESLGVRIGIATMATILLILAGFAIVLLIPRLSGIRAYTPSRRTAVRGAG
jgi:MFS family permease